jgi:hypothetical protein
MDFNNNRFNKNSSKFVTKIIAEKKSWAKRLKTKVKEARSVISWKWTKLCPQRKAHIISLLSPQKARHF